MKALKKWIIGWLWNYFVWKKDSKYPRCPPYLVLAKIILWFCKTLSSSMQLFPIIGSFYALNIKTGVFFISYNLYIADPSL